MIKNTEAVLDCALNVLHHDGDNGGGPVAHGFRGRHEMGRYLRQEAFDRRQVPRPKQRRGDFSDNEEEQV